MKTNTETKSKIETGKKPLLSRYVWRWPLLINIMALIGIIAALVGHYWLDMLSWFCLGTSVALIFYAYYFATSDK
jgi:hypothetical protein